MTPAEELRTAAEKLREAAEHATPGPWRPHDTWLDQGGHTATVLTDRPDLNVTELVAWLPTMSSNPWDETRNAWRNAGWMALMHPGVGLALADWLDETSRFAGLYAELTVMTTDTKPAEADYDQLTRHALAAARQLLGTTR